MNKDTVGFLIPFLVVYRWIGQKDVSAAFWQGALLSLIFIAGYWGLRQYFGTDREYLGGFWQLSTNAHFMLKRPDKAVMWLLPSLLPMVYCLRNRWLAPPIVRCFIPSLVLFVLGHLLISRIEEFRTYTPLALLMWPGVLAVYEGKTSAPGTRTPI